MTTTETPTTPIPDYWQESARPLVSLIFIAPMLLAYEIGMIALGPTAIRNGAEVWLRQFLDWIGFGQYFLLPCATCGVLLAWHHIARAGWRFRPSVLWGMSLESATLALGLLAFAQLQAVLCGDFGGELVCSTKSSHVDPNAAAGMVGYLGAGIYEELLFRLTLLPIAAMLLRGVGANRQTSLILAIVIVSVVFSLAHYRWDFDLCGVNFRSSGYPFDWFTFSFRAVAGMLFSILFVYRGFGIAVGAHALYDVFAVLA